MPLDERLPSFVLKRDAARFALVLLGATSFVAVGVWMWIMSAELDILLLPLVVKAMAAFVIAFFGPGALYAAYRLASPTALLVLDARGITDNSTALGVGFLPWSEVSNVYVYTFLGQESIVIVPRDAAALLSRLPRWKRVLIGFNRRLKAAPINIPQAALPVPLAQVREEILRRLDRARGDA